MAASEVFALLDDASPDKGQGARSRLYTGHARTLRCHDAAGWSALLGHLQDALAHGLYAVPLLSYELGAHLAGIPAKAQQQAQQQALAQVLLFTRCEHLDAAATAAWVAARTSSDKPGATPAGIAGVEQNVTREQFTHAVERIRAYIAAGDTYQVNYTWRLRFDAFGPLFALYARLRERQPVPYGALIALPDGSAVLSFSPELFVRHTGGMLEARPMKGTAPASDDDAENRRRATLLAADPKNRAENLMIVDLLRNDLGRVARTGSVAVPALFDVQRYGKVLQMTSTVEAQLAPGASLAAVFEALYPCGSITGAPKRRTMEIIHELEPDARGLYTGAIGWFDPPAPGQAIGDFCLSVPIRTLALQPLENGVRRGELGVGAGIVFDSVPDDEYAECQLKARFLTGLENQFDVFETMRASVDDGCRHLDAHLARMRCSSRYFGFPFDEAEARRLLTDTVAGLVPGVLHRVRLALGAGGRFAVQAAPIAPLAEPVRVLLADEPVGSSDVFLRHKTSIRSRYDAAWRAAEAQGAFDTLFFNERGELTEGGRTNVFVRFGTGWFTPPLSSGVLPGVMRSVLLAAPAWKASEHVITREMLEDADDIVVSNALRGPLRAVLA